MEIHGELVEICSAPKKTLTHWRELSFVCGEKKLTIYPDGGFINGWRIAKQPNREHFDVSDIQYDTRVYLYRGEIIKMDVSLEDN